ncbi:IS66 family insertion sequence element accessory protein TnpB [Caballeronia grimmiae]|uniref:IS66 family insertion sequence element accessory protein TnpB n=1 Tax=Caballeronia grimmiae TaxID=1071679 RepID=UPI0038BBB364
MAEVIALPAGTRFWLVAGVTDMRCGFQGLAAKVQTALEENPLGGNVFIFRGRRGDLVKLLWATDDGLWLLAKRLERGRFIWPQADGGKIHLTSAQLSMLLEGIDWCHRAALWSHSEGGVKAPPDGRRIGATQGAAHRSQQHRGENAIRTFQLGTLRSI